MIRKDEDLLESSWRAFWIAHDKVIIRSQLGFHETRELMRLKTWVNITIKQIYQNKQVHYGELMESFLESLWYTVYIEI